MTEPKETRLSFAHRVEDIACEILETDQITSVDDYFLQNPGLDFESEPEVKELAEIVERIDRDNGGDFVTWDLLEENSASSSPKHEIAAAMVIEDHDVVYSVSDRVKRILLDIMLESAILKVRMQQADAVVDKEYFNEPSEDEWMPEKIAFYRSLQAKLRERVSPAEAPERK